MIGLVGWWRRVERDGERKGLSRAEGEADLQANLYE
jgi:hypothetical protein